MPYKPIKKESVEDLARKKGKKIKRSLSLIEERRYGRFKIPRNFMYGPDDNVLQDIMKDIIVLRAEYLAVYDKFEYIAASKHFKKVPENCEPIEYVIDYETVEDMVEIESEDTDEVVTVTVQTYIFKGFKITD